MAQLQTLSSHLLGSIKKNSKKNTRTKPHVWFHNSMKDQEITVHKNEQEEPVNRMSLTLGSEG
jgi:hypothetical protein